MTGEQGESDGSTSGVRWPCWRGGVEWRGELTVGERVARFARETSSKRWGYALAMLNNEVSDLELLNFGEL